MIDHRDGYGRAVPERPPDRSASPHGLDDLYDIARLAERLGVAHATIRVWLSRRVPWLPPPDGRRNGGAVWRSATLEGIELLRRPGRPGPKPHPGPQAAAPAPHPSGGQPRGEHQGDGPPDR